MARSYGSIATAIWHDEDFWELTGEQQRVYLMLVTQADISPAGVLPLTLNRWASNTRGCTPEALSETLRGLSDALYVVIDWRREVLLVRSFVRWDKGYSNEKRLKAIQSAAIAVGSRELSGVLAHELNRLDIAHDIKAPPVDVRSMSHGRGIDGASMVNPAPFSAPDEPEIDGSHASPIEPDGRGIDRASKPAGSGYVSSYFPEPEPEPQTRQLKPPSSAASPPTVDGFDDFWEAYPKKVNKAEAERAWRRVARKTDPAVIIAGSQRMRDDPNLPVDRTKIPNPATWLNGERWNNPPYDPPLYVTGSPKSPAPTYGRPGERKGNYA